MALWLAGAQWHRECLIGGAGQHVIIVLIAVFAIVLIIMLDRVAMVTFMKMIGRFFRATRWRTSPTADPDRAVEPP